MPRQPDLQPLWLVSLLVNWGRHVRRRELGGLGYYSVNPMLKDGIATPARSYDPTGYTDGDWRSVDQTILKLQPVHQVAIIRYVMPEKAVAIQAEWGYSSDSWLRHLRSAFVLFQGHWEREAERV